MINDAINKDKVVQYINFILGSDVCDIFSVTSEWKTNICLN